VACLDTPFVAGEPEPSTQIRLLAAPGLAASEDLTVNFLPLLWSHRRALVLSAVVALLVAVPFGLLTPASYTSTSTVLFPTT